MNVDIKLNLDQLVRDEQISCDTIVSWLCEDLVWTSDNLNADSVLNLKLLVEFLLEPEDDWLKLPDSQNQLTA